MIRHAVRGIAQGCVADPDGVLYDLLAGAIDDCAARVAVARPSPDPAGSTAEVVAAR
jgi:hypothetical protein